MNEQVSTSPDELIPLKERQWAMFSHLSSFVGLILPLGNIISPLIMWQVKKEEYLFASEQAKECLNFQISILIYLFVSFILCFILIGIPLLFGFLIFDIVLTIIAAIAANEGKAYRYPLTIRFIR